MQVILFPCNPSDFERFPYVAFLSVTPKGEEGTYKFVRVFAFSNM
jgi:hypothetical protein